MLTTIDAQINSLTSAAGWLRTLQRSSWAAVLAMPLIVLGGPNVAAGPDCKPMLTVGQVSFSLPTNLLRYWSATVAVDASRCANSSGLFALGFSRLAENAPDLEFVEPFMWRAAETKVRVEFWVDEAVQSYWIADVASCRCRQE